VGGKTIPKQQVFECTCNDYYIGGEEDKTINALLQQICFVQK
jgi:hypothetical protein